MLSRRTFVIQLPVAGLAGSYTMRALAADKAVTIGINLPFTGADAHDAQLIKEGALMAIDAANAKGGVAGYKLNVLQLDDGTATAGQYDPAQAATNARKMVSDKSVVAAIGPQMSGSGKAMAPILSQGNLATITPSSTNPDITDPKFASTYMPGGKAIYISRTVTTDAFQGPNMANFMADTLKVKSVYSLDDSGAYQASRLSTAYENQAKKRGMNVLGHDQLDPEGSRLHDHPDQDQIDEPRRALLRRRRAGEGSRSSSSHTTLCRRSSAPAATAAFTVRKSSRAAASRPPEGVYATIAAPNILANPAAEPFVKAFAAKYGEQPENYSITAYDAALVILDAIERVAKSGKPVNRDNIRDAIQDLTGEDAARHRQLRQERRHHQPRRQRFPDPSGSQLPGRRRVASSTNISGLRHGDRRLSGSRKFALLGRFWWDAAPDILAFSLLVQEGPR